MFKKYSKTKRSAEGIFHNLMKRFHLRRTLIKIPTNTAHPVNKLPIWRKT